MPALVAGLGLAILPEFLAWQVIKDGALIELLPEWTIAADRPARGDAAGCCSPGAGHGVNRVLGSAPPPGSLGVRRAQRVGGVPAPQAI